MTMKRLLILMVLLFSVSVSATDLSKYPDLFIINDNFNGKIVVGKDAPSQDVASAVLLVPALQKESEERIDSAVLDEDVNDYMLHSNNIISMGCENEVTKKILESECNFEEGEGAIIIRESKLGMMWMVVAGGSPDDTEKAASVLAGYKDYELSGNSIRVTGIEMPYELSTFEEEDTDEEGVNYDAIAPPDKKPHETVKAVEKNDILEEDVLPDEKFQAKIDRLLEDDRPEQQDEESPEKTSQDDSDKPFLAKVWSDFKEWLGWFF